MTNIVLETPSLAFVCFFGVAIVFTGLVILIGLVNLMNYVNDKFAKGEPKKEEAPKAVAPAVSNTQIPNRPELVAAICSAIAEAEGTDISAIRVVSLKKL